LTATELSPFLLIACSLLGCTMAQELFTKRYLESVVQFLLKGLKYKAQTPSSWCFGPRVVSPFDCIHTAFLHQVVSHPEQLAITHLDCHISYAELELQSRNIALHLRQYGACPGTRVCLLVKRSIPMVAGIMGILRSGASYIPLDGGIVTDSTLANIIIDAQPVVILYSAEYASRTRGLGLPALSLEELTHKFEESEESDIDTVGHPRDEAYVIYTSGRYYQFSSFICSLTVSL
jgi:non-ribosomal peptide synthetase component F